MNMIPIKKPPTGRERPLRAKELLDLRQQIVLNSLFVSDYENEFGIDPNDVCTFFYGFVEFLEDKMREDGIDPQKQNSYTELDKYDTYENLMEYWNSFEESPLKIKEVR